MMGEPTQHPTGGAVNLPLLGIGTVRHRRLRPAEQQLGITP